MEEKASNKPADKSFNGKSLKKETPKDKRNKKLNEEYKKRYFDFYDDVKISDRQDW
ncbi:MAG: hypothetical protein J6T42_03560 [Clostridia bacterium]|nr:hypothetical protein [Clostridia bacterium]